MENCSETARAFFLYEYFLKYCSFKSDIYTFVDILANPSLATAGIKERILKRINFKSSSSLLTNFQLKANYLFSVGPLCY